jgi:hypothetical protein
VSTFFNGRKIIVFLRRVLTFANLQVFFHRLRQGNQRGRSHISEAGSSGTLMACAMQTTYSRTSGSLLLLLLLLLSSSCSPLSDTDLPRFMDLVMTDMMGGPCECVCLCPLGSFLGIFKLPDRMFIGFERRCCCSPLSDGGKWTSYSRYSCFSICKHASIAQDTKPNLAYLHRSHEMWK